MTHLFRELSLGHSRRDSTSSAAATMPSHPKPSLAAEYLPSPLGQLATFGLTDAYLRLTAFEIFVAACRTASDKNLTFVSSFSSSPTYSPAQPGSPAMQRSLTSAAASKMKKALGMKSPGSSWSRKSGGSAPGSENGEVKNALTVGELMRIQMKVSEAMDSRVRRAML